MFAQAYMAKRNSMFHSTRNDVAFGRSLSGHLITNLKSGCISPFSDTHLTATVEPTAKLRQAGAHVHCAFAGANSNYNLGNCVVSHPPPMALTSRTLASIRRR